MEGLESHDLDVKLRLVSQLPEYGYNRGAMLAAAQLLSESHDRLKAAAGEFYSFTLEIISANFKQ